MAACTTSRLSLHRAKRAPPFQCGPIAGVQAAPLQTHRDGRGWLIEMFRSDDLPAEFLPQMAYVSETLPGVVRGPHEHVEQADCFVFVGPGDFLVRLWDARVDSPTYWHTCDLVLGQSQPSRLIVPPGVVHGYKNISPYPGWVFNAPNRLYAGKGRREEVDEIRHELNPDSPFVLAEGLAMAAAAA